MGIPLLWSEFWRSWRLFNGPSRVLCGGIDTALMDWWHDGYSDAWDEANVGAPRLNAFFLWAYRAGFRQCISERAGGLATWHERELLAEEAGEEEWT